jgi:hypothetical protein
MGERWGVYRVVVGKLEGRSLGRPKRREDNIKMDLNETGWGAWIWLRIGTGGGHL